MRCPLPVSCELASRADRLRLLFLLKRQRPLEQRRCCGLGLSLATLRLNLLVGHELSPGEQRPLRLVGFVVASVGSVAVNLYRYMAVAIDLAATANNQLDCRPDLEGVVMGVAVCTVAVDPYGFGLKLDTLPAIVHQEFFGGDLGVPCLCEHLLSRLGVLFLPADDLPC